MGCGSSTAAAVITASNFSPSAGKNPTALTRRKSQAQLRRLSKSQSSSGITQVAASSQPKARAVSHQDRNAQAGPAAVKEVTAASQEQDSGDAAKYSKDKARSMAVNQSTSDQEKDSTLADQENASLSATDTVKSDAEAELQLEHVESEVVVVCEDAASSVHYDGVHPDAPSKEQQSESSGTAPGKQVSSVNSSSTILGPAVDLESSRSAHGIGVAVTTAQRSTQSSHNIRSRHTDATQGDQMKKSTDSDSSVAKALLNSPLSTDDSSAVLSPEATDSKETSASSCKANPGQDLSPPQKLEASQSAACVRVGIQSDRATHSSYAMVDLSKTPSSKKHKEGSMDAATCSEGNHDSSDKGKTETARTKQHRKEVPGSPVALDASQSSVEVRSALQSSDKRATSSSSGVLGIPNASMLTIVASPDLVQSSDPLPSATTAEDVQMSPPEATPKIADKTEDSVDTKSPVKTDIAEAFVPSLGPPVELVATQSTVMTGTNHTFNTGKSASHSSHVIGTIPQPMEGSMATPKAHCNEPHRERNATSNDQRTDHRQLAGDQEQQVVKPTRVLDPPAVLLSSQSTAATQTKRVDSTDRSTCSSAAAVDLTISAAKQPAVAVHCNQAATSEPIGQDKLPAPADRETVPTFAGEETVPTPADSTTPPNPVGEETVPITTPSDDDASPTAADDQTIPVHANEETQPTIGDEQRRLAPTDQQETRTILDIEVPPTVGHHEDVLQTVEMPPEGPIDEGTGGQVIGKVSLGQPQTLLASQSACTVDKVKLSSTVMRTQSSTTILDATAVPSSMQSNSQEKRPSSSIEGSEVENHPPQTAGKQTEECQPNTSSIPATAISVPPDTPTTFQATQSASSINKSSLEGEDTASKSSIVTEDTIPAAGLPAEDDHDRSAEPGLVSDQTCEAEPADNDLASSKAQSTTNEQNLADVNGQHGKSFVPVLVASQQPLLCSASASNVGTADSSEVKEKLQSNSSQALCSASSSRAEKKMNLPMIEIHIQVPSVHSSRQDLRHIDGVSSSGKVTATQAPDNSGSEPEPAQEAGAGSGQSEEVSDSATGDAQPGGEASGTSEAVIDQREASEAKCSTGQTTTVPGPNSSSHFSQAQQLAEEAKHVKLRSTSASGVNTVGSAQAEGIGRKDVGEKEEASKCTDQAEATSEVPVKQECLADEQKSNSGEVTGSVEVTGQVQVQEVEAIAAELPPKGDGIGQETLGNENQSSQEAHINPTARVQSIAGTSDGGAESECHVPNCNESQGDAPGLENGLATEKSTDEAIPITIQEAKPGVEECAVIVTEAISPSHESDTTASATAKSASELLVGEVRITSKSMSAFVKSGDSDEEGQPTSLKTSALIGGSASNLDKVSASSKPLKIRKQRSSGSRESLHSSRSSITRTSSKSLVSGSQSSIGTRPKIGGS